jgi:hypothetical protein
MFFTVLCLTTKIIPSILVHVLPCLLVCLDMREGDITLFISVYFKKM